MTITGYLQVVMKSGFAWRPTDAVERLMRVIGTTKKPLVKCTYVYDELCRTDSDPNCVTPVADQEFVSQGIRMLSHAYSCGVRYALTPALAWYFIVNEIATFIRENPSTHSSLFVPENYGLRIVVNQCDDDGGPLEWRDELQRAMRHEFNAFGEEIILDHPFLKKGRANTNETSLALMGAFHRPIPKRSTVAWNPTGLAQPISLEGTSEDWQSIIAAVQKLAGELDELQAYFNGLLRVLKKIRDCTSYTKTTADDRYQFLSQAFKRAGSLPGSTINGWINAFFAYNYTLGRPAFKLDHNWRNYGLGGGVPDTFFPVHLHQVDFELRDKEFIHKSMVLTTGLTGSWWNGASITPQFGYAVF